MISEGLQHLGQAAGLRGRPSGTDARAGAASQRRAQCAGLRSVGASAPAGRFIRVAIIGNTAADSTPAPTSAAAF